MALNPSVRVRAAMSKDIVSAEAERSKVPFPYQKRKCSAMHNIPNAYPSPLPSEHMASEIESITRIDAQLLKQMSRMYEAGISIKDISGELKTDQQTAKRLLKLLGYVYAI